MLLLPEEVITLGRSFSGAGKASSEFVEDGEREHRPRKFGTVSNTCNCCGNTVNVYTLIREFKYNDNSILSQPNRSNFSIAFQQFHCFKYGYSIYVCTQTSKTLTDIEPE